YFYPDIAHFLGKTTPNGQPIQTTEDLCFYLIEAGVAVIPGTAFGTSHHIRISYAYAPEILELAVARLKAGLEALR
ncbi:MAG: aspartate aminotransferase, partial [Bacteroidia bacterium]